MELDERKLKILQAIIRNYLETGEPVGSRTISKYTDLNLSSATIRNEMSDLEELGYILQPHTSAGRIPSDKGYRLYVDRMMQEKEEQLSQATQEVRELHKLLLEREDKMESVLKQMAKRLAADTNYATMISAPQMRGNKLKFIQLSRVDKGQLLTTIVIEGNVIKNSMIAIDDPLDDEMLWKLNILLNTNLNGMPIEGINLAMISKLKQQAGAYANIVAAVMDAVEAEIKDDEDVEIYTSGANNIFKYPELADNRRASELINTLEEKQLLTELVNETLSDDAGTGIQVYIGNETPVKTMKDCSVVTATYELEEGVRGTIGIIGPRRMDYDKVVHTLKTLKSQLEVIYKKDDGQTSKTDIAYRKDDE
ncbi:MAG: heat-inducible transcriptional repressor HrcA [Lachnospiraceae bacterium]|nr:heat-inducible transcriptional repressor HrcA [Lachnospiraceae bacterium]